MSNRELAGVTSLLCVVTVFGYVFITAYRPPLLQFLLSAVLVGALFLLAWRIPSKTGRNGSLSPWRPSRLVLFGFFATLALFLLFGAGPNIIGYPPVLMLLGIALIFMVFSLLKRYEWNERRLYHKFALAAGAVGFFIILTPLQEFDTSRLDNTQGMFIVGIVTTIMLVLLRKRLKSRACKSSYNASKQCGHFFPES